jgi:hypothetical protein
VKEGLGSRPGKITVEGLAGLAGTGENRYIGANLWFSYDRVLRVGPAGPALFYYPNRPDRGYGAGHGSGCATGLPGGPPSTQLKLETQLKLDCL